MFFSFRGLIGNNEERSLLCLKRPVVFALGENCWLYIKDLFTVKDAPTFLSLLRLIRTFGLVVSDYLLLGLMLIVDLGDKARRGF